MGLSGDWKGLAQAGGIALLLIGALIGVLIALDGPDAFTWGGSSLEAEAQPSAADELAEKVRPGPITSAEQRDLEGALVFRFPGGSRVAAGNVAFYFDGKATACGTVSPRGGSPRRYMYRNDFLLVEGDASSSDFAMFWQICEAGGA